MANPVQNQQPHAHLAAPEQQINPVVPRGVGAVPDALHPAAQPREYRLGYVETFIYGVRDCILWVLKKVFPCWFPEPPEPIAPPPPEPPPRIMRPQLKPEIQIEVELQEALDRMTDRQKERIYRLIGVEATHFYYPGQWLRSYEEIGQIEVLKNPRILERYIHFNQDQVEI